jgi:hypothetical protein
VPVAAPLIFFNQWLGIAQPFLILIAEHAHNLPEHPQDGKDRPGAEADGNEIFRNELLLDSGCPYHQAEDYRKRKEPKLQ